MFRTLSISILLLLAACEKPCPKGQKRVQFNCTTDMILMPDGNGGFSYVWMDDCDTKCVAAEVLR